MSEEAPFGTSYRWQRDLNEALSEVRRANPGPPSSRKTVFFIRHAQSQSNVAKDGMQLGRITGAFRLCTAGFDSDLSVYGRSQLLEVRPSAQEIVDELEAVLFSPLSRATQTAETLFGEEDGSGGFRPPPGKFWRAVRGLKETRFQEHAQQTLARSQSIQRRRVCALIRFLNSLPWKNIALVGHSRLFRMMMQYMKVDMAFRNACIWRMSVEALGDSNLRCLSKQLVAQPTSGGSSPEGEASPDGDEACDGNKSASWCDGDESAKSKNVVIICKE